MPDQSLLDSDGSPLPLPPDPLSPVPDEVERGLVAYRAGDVSESRALLTTLARAGRTAVSGHAAMALAGIELGQNGSYRRWLEQVAGGEDPWLGPLAAVMLSPDFESSADEVILRSLAAQLTGDLDTARNGFEQAANDHEGPQIGDLGIILMTGELGNLLLGNLLLQIGEPDASFEPLTYARDMCDGLLAGYAGYLEGHVLIGRNETNQAAEALQYAHSESHPAGGGSRELHPWVALRFGELLAGDPFGVDLIYDQMERSGVSMGEVVREPFESALYFKDDKEADGPSLVDVGFHPFPADFEPVHAAMERLSTWSDERYERGRRLVLALHTHVDNILDKERTQGLAELRKRLDLPQPR